jgi:hypothetical protein
MGSSYLAQLRNGSANGNGHKAKPSPWIRGMKFGEHINVENFVRIVVSGDTDERKGRGYANRTLRAEVETPNGKRFVLLGDAAVELLRRCGIPVPELSLDVVAPKYVDRVVPDD